MVVLSVHGSARRFLPAERGTVLLTLSLEHADHEPVVRGVAALHERFVAEAKAQVDSGAATWWGSDQVRVGTRRRYVKDSDTTYLVHVASAEVRVKFRDFAALSTWVTASASEAGVEVSRVVWAVTEQHREQVEREVRVQAVADATQRAQAYAGAIGAESVVLQQLWEPGLRPSGVGGGAGEYTRVQALSAFSNTSDFEFRPDDIEIEAEITADFVTA